VSVKRETGPRGAADETRARRPVVLQELGPLSVPLAAALELRDAFGGLVNRELIENVANAGYVAHAFDQRVVLVREYRSAQRHLAVRRLHVDRAGMRHVAAHFGAHALDQHVIGGGTLVQHRAHTPGDRAAAIREIARAFVREIRSLGGGLHGLIANQRAPAAALVRIEEEHCCATECDADEE
jgi:hypothetical protein